jgi:cysteine desulfurase
VLRALGRDDTLSESSLRFGLGRSTSETDIDTAVAVVGEAVSRLRKISGA